MSAKNRPYQLITLRIIPGKSVKKKTSTGKHDCLPIVFPENSYLLQVKFFEMSGLRFPGMLQILPPSKKINNPKQTVQGSKTTVLVKEPRPSGTVG